MSPRRVHFCIAAALAQQRYRQAGHGAGLHVRENLLQHGQAAYAYDRLDLSGLYQTHHNRRAFSHKHRISELLGFVLEFGDIASPATRADQADIVEMAFAVSRVFQALRKQQKAFVVRDCSHGGAPRRVVD